MPEQPNPPGIKYFENTSNGSIIEILGPDHTREWTVEVTEQSTLFKYIELKNADLVKLLQDEISLVPISEADFQHRMEKINTELNRITNEL